MKAEQLRQELKHKKQWDNLQAKNEAATKELDQLQVCFMCKNCFKWPENGANKKKI